ncbi:hypothetical protein BAVI_04849 [Neobacillus vireti LMG 21834]|uniref:Spore germination protein n=1 Tax=Neobacillus vireti LMG 21834 TaxID=1131730 RepID=A0AB94ISN6_9BACI|nr:hypothetical protein BAVI_04849 [Neobacillus vireti LMG 21834]KLT15164.1 hypothetical protein AA980_25145 [Neobacillus vireti]
MLFMQYFLYVIFPWLTLLIAIFLFFWSMSTKSWKLMLLSVVVFLPDTLFLVFMDLEKILNIFLFLPILQIIFMIILFTTRENNTI